MAKLSNLITQLEAEMSKSNDIIEMLTSMETLIWRYSEATIHMKKAIETLCKASPERKLGDSSMELQKTVDGIFGYPLQQTRKKGINDV